MQSRQLVRGILSLAAAFAGVLLLPGATHAQWTVISLKAAGATDSWSFGGSATQQVGGAIFGSDGHAGLWNGTAASWIDLHPAGATSSRAQGTTSPGAPQQQQVGHAFFALSQNVHAGLWSGSAASWVDLNPAGSTESSAYGTSGTQQAGYTRIGLNREHAALWSGTAGSRIDLNPVGSVGSLAYGTTGTRQFGYAGVGFGGNAHAGLWSGSAASWTDLHPAGAVQSEVFGMFGTQQVGRATFGGSDHAGLWTGSAASWVDLNPAGSGYSWANATTGTQQVGGAIIDGIQYAGLWSGSAASWEILPLPLTGSWDTNAVAKSIWNDGAYTYVSGYGHNRDTGHDEALLWSRPLPEPGSAGWLGLVGLSTLCRRKRQSRR